MEADERKAKRWTKHRMGPLTGPVARRGRVVQELVLGSGRYVQRYVPCGKGCSRCVKGGAAYDSNRPGHGPYWYWERNVNGKKVRKYVGVELTPDFLKAADVAPPASEGGPDR